MEYQFSIAGLTGVRALPGEGDSETAQQEGIELAPLVKKRAVKGCLSKF